MININSASFLNNYYYNNRNKIKSNSPMNKNCVSFGKGQEATDIHPFFDTIPKRYRSDYNLSGFFRRDVGYFGITPEEKKEYGGITAWVFRKVFREPIEEPKKMLIIGIGNSQEPFSYLASISAITNKPLEDVVDLHCLDIQPMPSKEKLKRDSFLEKDFMSHEIKEDTPEYTVSSFVDENGRKRVRDDIFEYLLKTYQDPDKSDWAQTAQERVPQYEDGQFDVISMNNVLGYILISETEEQDKKNEKTATKLLHDIAKKLKPGGILITDEYRHAYVAERIQDIAKFRALDNGIFQKIA